MSNVTAREGRTAPSALGPEQRVSLWKWRWLGLRKSTPAFKASLVLLAAVAFALGAYTVVIGR